MEIINRKMIDYSKFQLSLKRLEEQHDNYRNLDPNLSAPTYEAFAESVIRRFKTCYDCLWKILKRYLSQELGITDPPNSPKPIFRLAHENGLFVSPPESWFDYVQARIGTSHDYDGEKVKDCLELMPDFIDDAIGLYQTMTAKTWE